MTRLVWYAAKTTHHTNRMSCSGYFTVTAS
jgi:hypothetical protein